VSRSTATWTQVTSNGEIQDGDGQQAISERNEPEDPSAEVSAEITVKNASTGGYLVVLQVNCRSICNKVLEFWNLIETHNPDVVIGTESWLHEDINNAELFRDNFITFRRDRCSRGGGVFICVKNHIDCRELWVDDEFEMLAIEVKSRNQKSTWEIIGMYRAPNEDMRTLERLIARTGCTNNPAKRSIIGGDLNLPQVDWNGKVEGQNVTQALINSLVWENGYTQVIDRPTRGDAILDVYLVRPESTWTSSSIVQGISDHQGVILEVDWDENFIKPQPGRVIPVYNGTDVLGLQSFLRDRFTDWASNGSSVEQIWNHFKNIVYESVDRFVPHKILKTNTDPEYYNTDIKRLKAKVRIAYSRRKLGGQHMDKLKQLSKELLAAKKQAQEEYLKTLLSKEGKCWTDFYKYVKRRKGNREAIPAMKDENGRIITEPKEKANLLNSYYSTVFNSEYNTPHIEGTITAVPFEIDIKTIRGRVRALGKNKSVGTDRIPGEMLKMGGEAMIPYLARLLEITMNNGSLPGDWKTATVVPIHKGGDRSLVTNYRPVSLTSVVCKQMEQVVASYLRRVWDGNDWLYKGQHGFRPGYSCESQVSTVCQDISDTLDNGDRMDAIFVDFSKAFDLVPHGRLLVKIANSGVDIRVVTWIREFLTGRTQRVRIGGELSDEIRVTSGVPQGSVLGPLLFLAYINDISKNIKSHIKLFADDCVIYRKILAAEDIIILQSDVDSLGEWAVENEMKINPNKSKAVCFTRARKKDPLKYFLLGTLVPEASSYKYLGIIIRSDLNWADQVNYTVKKAWKALHFIMRILKNGSNNTKRLAYTSLVRPILEYGASCWDPYREGQIKELDRVQKKAAKFAHHTNDPELETLASRRKIARLCALYKAYCGEIAWKDIGDRLERPHYLSRVDHNLKIRIRRQRTDIGKYSFVNRTIQHWNQLPVEVLNPLPRNSAIFRKRARKVLSEVR
jgi:hypothetical protein